MTLAAAQLLRQAGDVELLGSHETGYIHSLKFGYFEPRVNRKVRTWHNDAGQRAGQTSNMSKFNVPEPGWFVSEWLKHLDLKQKDLVQRTKWNKSQISEWVTGEERWNRDVLYTLAHAMGVEAADLLRPPPSDPVDYEFIRLAAKLDHREKARLLRLWQAAQEEAA